ncbi:MAG: hypothetical protein AB1846_13945 [Chloroflexota bacterium]
MQKVTGYILIFLGIACVILSVLVWLGVISPPAGLSLGQATGWDVLLVLLEKLPWLAVVGLLLIYAGLKMIDVKLPF